MELAQEEAFGPVAPILTVDDETEAIEVANDTKFGLGASIWTQNLIRQKNIQKQLRLG